MSSNTLFPPLQYALIFMVWAAGASGESCLQGDCERGAGVSIDKKDIYVGTFLNGKKDGMGTLSSLTGSYFGELKNGKKHGEGTYLESGRKGSELQQGKWRKNKLISKSSVALDKTIHPGWQNNNCSNVGSTHLFRDGTIYVGGCKENQPHGEGVLLYISHKITGNFNMGKLEGSAVLYYQDGTSETQKYRNNQLVN